MVTFLGYAHQGLLQPILPLYLKQLGGSELLIGFALAAFSLTSFSLRPAIGFLTDEWRVAGVLTVGVLVLGLGGIALFVPWVWLIFVSNAVRGIGWAALNTAGGTLLAHIAPVARRAEAAGYLTMFQSAATAISSPLALWLASLATSNFGPVFVLSALTGVLAAAFARFIPEPVLARPADRPTFGLRTLRQMLDGDVVFPMVLQACLVLSFPALNSFVALYAEQVGLDASSAAWYFLANGLTAVAIRVVLGRALDRLNRALSTAVGFALLSLSIVLMAAVPSLAWLLVVGVVYAVGYAIASASLIAMAIDMANPNRRGAAMATYSMSNQIGVGIGAALSGAIIEAAGYRAMYAAVLLPGLAAMVALWFTRKRFSRMEPSHG